MGKRDNRPSHMPFQNSGDDERLKRPVRGAGRSVKSPWLPGVPDKSSQEDICSDQHAPGQASWLLVPLSQVQVYGTLDSSGPWAPDLGIPITDAHLPLRCPEEHSFHLPDRWSKYLSRPPEHSEMGEESSQANRVTLAQAQVCAGGRLKPSLL